MLSKLPQEPVPLFWRRAADWPLPEPEGGRALLIWSPPMEIRVYESHGSAWVGSSCACGEGNLQPGERPPLYWCWADGDPWTRISKQARADEKALHLGRALTRTQQGVLDTSRSYGVPQLGLPGASLPFFNARTPNLNAPFWLAAPTESEVADALLVQFPDLYENDAEGRMSDARVFRRRVAEGSGT